MLFVEEPSRGKNMSRFVDKSMLAEHKWYGLHHGSILPAFCEECDCQRTHIIVGFAKQGHKILVKLDCLACLEKNNGK